MHEEDSLTDVVEDSGLIEGERDAMPEPSIYFGPDVKKFDMPVYEKVPAFTQAWLLRIMYYRFYAYKYVLKSDLNQCLHANLRRKNLDVNFGMKWIWSAVREMIEGVSDDEPNSQYRTLEWVYDDDFTTIKKRKRDELNQHQGVVPTKIRLTNFGRKIAIQLGEGAKKHNKIRKPPLDQKRDDISDNDEIIQASLAHSDNPMMDHPLAGGSLQDHEDCKNIMSNLETLLTELAYLRKEVRRLDILSKHQHQLLQAHRQQQIDMSFEHNSQGGSQSQQYEHHHHVTSENHHDYVGNDAGYAETSSSSPRAEPHH